MIPLGISSAAAAAIAAFAGIAAPLARVRGGVALASGVVVAAALIGIVRPSPALLDVLAPTAWIWVGVVAAQRFGHPRLRVLTHPVGLLPASLVLGGWITSAAIVEASRSPGRAARLATAAWLFASVSPLGTAVGWTAARTGAYFLALLPIAVLALAILRPRRLPVAPAPPERPREPVLVVAAVVAMLVHGAGLAWHLGALARQAPPLVSCLAGIVAGTVADPAVGAMIVERVAHLAPPDAAPAILATRLGLATAPGPVGLLLWRRFGIRGLVRALPWLLVPPGLALAWFGFTA